MNHTRRVSLFVVVCRIAPLACGCYNVAHRGKHSAQITCAAPTVVLLDSAMPTEGHRAFQGDFPSTNPIFLPSLAEA